MQQTLEKDGGRHGEVALLRRAHPMRCILIASALNLLPDLCVHSAVLAAAPGSDCSMVPGVRVMGWAALQPLAQPGLGSVMCPFPVP